MKILAIIIIVCIALYVILGLFVFRKSLRAKKLLVVLFIASAGYLTYSGGFVKTNQETNYAGENIPAFQLVAPDITKAPYVVQTYSRAYYVASYKNNGTSLTLYDYWAYDKKNWVYSNRPITLDGKLFKAKLFKR